MRSKQGKSSALRKLALAAALAAVSFQAGATLVADGKYDSTEGYQLGVTFGIDDTHGTTNYGKLYFGQDASGQYLYIQMPLGYVDNTYGTNAASDWFSGHTFNDLLSGDTQTISWGGTAANRTNTVTLDYLVDCGNPNPGGCSPSGYDTGSKTATKGSASAITAFNTSLDYDLNTVVNGTSANTNSPGANPNWIKEVGYEIKFAPGTFNASDWVNKDKAPGLITLADPGVSPSKKTFKDYTPPTCTMGCTQVPEPSTNVLLGIGALSLLWFARRRQVARAPYALGRLIS
jgi:PEP-CTERM motif